MKQKSQLLLIFALLGGTVFAWYTVFGDFSRYFGAGGQITSFSGCRYPNPLATPCFYGAIMFIVALAWALAIYLSSKEKARSLQHLSWLLLAGTIFAWGNFSYEMYRYYAPHNGPFLSCSGTLSAHPIRTPCFYGAAIYLLSLAISILAIRVLKKEQAI